MQERSMPDFMDSPREQHDQYAVKRQDVITFSFGNLHGIEVPAERDI
jgi:fructose/tagatose bisphosphate aldolase